MNRCAGAMTNTDRSMDGTVHLDELTSPPRSWLAIDHRFAAWSSGLLDIAENYRFSQNVYSRHDTTIFHLSSRFSWVVVSSLFPIKGMYVCMLHEIWGSLMLFSRANGPSSRNRHSLKWCSIRQSLYVIHSSIRVSVFLTVISFF